MGDFSRDSNDPRRHYSGVLMQQGRVQLDADWNEQLAIQLHRTRAEAVDTVGACGAPKKGGGFQIGLTPDALDLTVSPGRIYVGGLLCELDATAFPIEFVQNAANRARVESLYVDGVMLAQGQWVEISAAGKTGTKLLLITGVDAGARVLTFGDSVLNFQNAGAARLRRVATLRTQPDYPNPDFAGLILGPGPGQPTSPPSSPLSSPPASAADGLYLAYVEAWEREVTALDDPHLREVALGGPDTATRLRTVWQVKLLRLTPAQGLDATCETRFAEWDNLTARPTGLLNARTKPPEDEKDPCLLPPNTGFTRLENQLYRVEVHRGGTRQTATFKWSRDNAVVRTSVLKVSGAILTVADVGRDEVLSFAGGQWVEVTDEESVLKGAPRQLVQIASVDPTTREITLQTTPAGLAGRKNLQLVRWDQTGPASPDGLSMGADWVELEGGVQVLFSEGTYRAGDYWLIPARTATGRVEWPPFADPSAAPAPQPPAGTRHHFCRLALLDVKGGIINIEDCRELFPALTDICAEDICVDNTSCDLPDVGNLQDMLDRLCAARDLRWHNKHLHGWGIVCGLQVECGPDPAGQPRRHVTVRPGYALDCEGRDIVLESAERLDLIQMIADAGLNLDSSPPASPPASPPFVRDGEVCISLKLDEGGRRRYSLEKYQPPPNPWTSILSGTILMDFYEQCLKPLIDFGKEEFEPDLGKETALVGPARKRALTFSNLFIQYANPVNGSRVFLSGDRAQPVADHEHTILRESFERLRDRLRSHTFCAMFEGSRPFPEYPFTGTGISTIFGRGPHNRVRLRPDARAAYTCGIDGRINVYDLDKNEMAAELEFPGGLGAVVRDVAFSADGSQLYAVATFGTKDSMFAVADVSGFKHTWRRPSIVCDVQLVTLATNSVVPGKVFAIGKGTGLYLFDPQNVPEKPQPRNAFNAVGHLVTPDGIDMAFATMADPTSPPGATDLYRRVLRLNLVGQPATPLTFTLEMFEQAVTGRDDIAVSVTPAGTGVVGATGETPPTVKLYVVVEFQGSRYVTAYQGPTPSSGKKHINLQENTRVRLAHNDVTRTLMITFEDSYRVGLLNATDQLTDFYHPVQINPIAIAMLPKGNNVYVLNFNPLGNTLNEIPSQGFTPDNQFDIDALVQYRADVLEAFTDLEAGLLQYLKDCFCDLLLVNCPTCDPDEKIYLACVRIQGGQVFKVCNFSLRKYVKSFPTVEYWLSLFPIIPLVGKMFEEFCCAVLPNFFGGFTARRDTVSAQGFATAENRFTGQQAESGVTYARQTDFRAIFNDQMAKVAAGRKIAVESVVSTIMGTGDEPAQAAPAFVTADLSGMSVEDASARLASAGVTVEGVEKYEPTRGASNIARLARAPVRLKRGSRVTLVEQDGVVRLAEETRADPGALDRSETLKQEISGLRDELKLAQQKHAEELAARDQEIGELRAATQEFRTQLKTLDSLYEKVESLTQVVRIPEPSKESPAAEATPGSDDAPESKA